MWAVERDKKWEWGGGGKECGLSREIRNGEGRG